MLLCGARTKMSKFVYCGSCGPCDVSRDGRRESRRDQGVQFQSGRHKAWGEIGPEFEQATGHKLPSAICFSPVFVKRINDGEPFDIIASPTARRIMSWLKSTVERPSRKCPPRSRARNMDAARARWHSASPMSVPPRPSSARCSSARSVGGIRDSGCAGTAWTSRHWLPHQSRKVTIPTLYRERVGRQRGTRKLESSRSPRSSRRPVSISRSRLPEIQVYTVFEGAVSANSNASEAPRAPNEPPSTCPAAIRVVKAQAGMSREIGQSGR